METNGWKDGKFDPDSVEPDYEFALGEGPGVEPDSTVLFGQQVPVQPGPMQASPELPKDAIKAIRKVALKILWEGIHKTNTDVLIDENNMFVIKNKQGCVTIKPEYIEEK